MVAIKSANIEVTSLIIITWHVVPDVTSVRLKGELISISSCKWY